jgi:hypothetical protein
MPKHLYCDRYVYTLRRNESIRQLVDTIRDAITRDQPVTVNLANEGQLILSGKQLQAVLLFDTTVGGREVEAPVTLSSAMISGNPKAMISKSDT